MKILLIADFHYDTPRFLLNNSRFFGKGFILNGHDVREFGYRQTLLALSPIKSKKWALKLAKQKTDSLLIETARHYLPNLVLITAFRLLDEHTISRLKEAIPKALFMCWYGDPPRGIDAEVFDIARHCDWFLSTSGGEVLQQFKPLVSHCAFMPNPCDPDIEYPRQVPDQWRSKLLFTGKLKHSLADQDPIRWELIKRLIDEQGMTVWGCLDKPRLEGIDYINAICGTQMALSINVYNDVRFYHSDRLMHFLACGVFVVAKYVPDNELLFENEKHLTCFNEIEQCLEIVKRYSSDDAARKRIARAGRERAVEEFHYQKLAGHIIDLAEKGDFQASWKEIL